jgi:pimeloyl-ACP methyl ester carboxylesterase
MAVTMVPVGDGVELCAETYGDPGDPTLLLLAGATGSMDSWDPELCERLAAGRFVIRYDHRDTGQSTGWPVGQPGYTGEDLDLDPLRLLDGLGIAAAHLVGVSMGGGIAQDLAVRFPDRVLSLTLIATTAAFERADPTPLPGTEPRVEAVLSGQDFDQWEDREAVVEEQVRVERVLAGSRGIDEQRTRAAARRTVARTPDVHAAVTNHWLVVGGAGAKEEPRAMGEVRVPTLVVHGSDDPMFPLPHGQALAAEIPGATLLVVDGMGHSAPPPSSWDQVVPAIRTLTQSR